MTQNPDRLGQDGTDTPFLGALRWFTPNTNTRKLQQFQYSGSLNMNDWFDVPNFNEWELPVTPEPVPETVGVTADDAAQSDDANIETEAVEPLSAGEVSVEDLRATPVVGQSTVEQMRQRQGGPATAADDEDKSRYNF